ncbi:MAG: type II toxin-antitoxin system HicB family antitoxin [Verrucomicrobiota bacterium]|jgi:hypothetical protein
MLTEYLRAGMAKARYELLGDGKGFYGEIPGFRGVLAQAETIEACREELAGTLEDWLLFRISRLCPRRWTEATVNLRPVPVPQKLFREFRKGPL